MLQRCSPRLASWAGILLLGVAAGCGGEDAVSPPRDAGSPSDVRAALPETQALSLDTPFPAVEAGAIPDASSSEAGAEASPMPAVSVVILPDTQYYAAAYPDVFADQTDWILGQKTALNIAAVLHVGDIVDTSNDPEQWNVAGSAMHSLDGIVPYVVVPGNHDCNNQRVGMTDLYFAPATMPWITGTMVAGQIENNYALIDIGGVQWLVVGIEFGPRDAVVAWADSVFKAYADRPAILLTHAYLYSDGTRYNLSVGGTDPNQPSYQYWNPAYYGFTPSEGINDGEAMWQKLVLPNPNVRLVFCGHQTGGARMSSSRPDGSVVHQMLSDYQWLDGVDFGFGYLRVVKFDYASKTIRVQTYSPYLDSYLTDDENQFTLNMNF